MFGGASVGKYLAVDAAVVTIFVIAIVVVGVITLRELGRRR
jgi:phage shock protein PspC (stress-responsive transcriptional regulator)